MCNALSVRYGTLCPNPSPSHRDHTHTAFLMMVMVAAAAAAAAAAVLNCGVASPTVQFAAPVLVK